MHQHFDGMDCVIAKCPNIIIHCVSVSPSPTDMSMNDRGDTEARFMVVVHIIFRNIQLYQENIPYLKDGGESVDDRSYKLDLFFLDGESAKQYLDVKESETRKIWEQKSQA